MNLLDLPDEILVRILQLHGHDGLLRLEEVCSRFKALLGHSLVWRDIAFWRPVSLRELRRCLAYAGPVTRDGNLWSCSSQGGKTPVFWGVLLCVFF